MAIYPPGALYEHAIRYEKDASIAENGALVAYSEPAARPGTRLVRHRQADQAGRHSCDHRAIRSGALIEAKTTGVSTTRVTRRQ